MVKTLLIGQLISRKLQAVMRSSAVLLISNITGSETCLQGCPHGKPHFSPMATIYVEGPLSWLCLLWCLFPNATKWTITPQFQHPYLAFFNATYYSKGLCKHTIEKALWSTEKIHKWAHFTSSQSIPHCVEGFGEILYLSYGSFPNLASSFLIDTGNHFHTNMHRV